MSGEEPWINLLLGTSTKRKCRMGTERKEEREKGRCKRKRKARHRQSEDSMSVWMYRCWNDRWIIIWHMFVCAGGEGGAYTVCIHV